MSADTITAFAGFKRLAQGSRSEVFAQMRACPDTSAVLLFDDASGALVDLDLRPPPQRAAEAAIEEAPRGVGRPRLGVVAREVTLLPRHWEWLASQPGGASVTLRKLVEAARRDGSSADRTRLAQEATYRFALAMAGDEPGFEEAIRALYASNAERFRAVTVAWPADVRKHVRALAAGAFGGAA